MADGMHLVEDNAKKRNPASSLADISELLIIALDSTGRIVGFNRACEELTGFAARKVVGRFIWDSLLPPEEHEHAKAFFRRLESDKLPPTSQSHIFDKHGERRLISWSNSLLQRPGAGTPWVIRAGIDITDRKLADGFARLKTEILSQISDAIVAIDKEHR
ncbi:MAG TPA: PAS domain S-box protein, partial [Blastocatellia bacterium]|nr:PAS domain S-box protein [Blastocatellia bacterium]